MVAAACGSAPGGGGNDGGTSASCNGVPPQSLDSVFSRYFAAGAASSCVNGCHAGGAGGLTFSDAPGFHAATVGVTSKTQPTMALVAPGNPEGSHLYQRLLPSASSRMPSGGTYLDAASLNEVAGWICAGAPSLDGGTGTTAVMPTLTSFTPSSGYVGTAVTISGSGFSALPSGNDVRFNGMQAEVFAATPTSLQVYVPTGASTGRVTVKVGTQSASSASDFTVLAGNPVPVISSLSPCGVVAGAGGVTLTVDGRNFVTGASVTLRGTAATSTLLVSATQLQATFPSSTVASAPAGNVTSVIVTNPGPGGGASLAADFGIAGSFSTLGGKVQNIFTNSCLGSGCHSAGQQAPTLEVGASRAALVDQPSSGCPSKLRVRACSPSRARSFLIDKILASGQSPACSGSAMPKGKPLNAADSQAIVDWVAQGAPP